MKVLHVSISLRGGAGGATYRLHTAMRSRGIDSRVLVRKKRVSDDNVIAAPFRRTTRLARGLARRLRLGDLDTLPVRFYRARDRNPNAEIFSTQWLPDSVRRVADSVRPDIVNLQWAFGGWLRIETVPELPGPVVWTLHDMWPLTGGCYHSEECDGYTKSCGRCPRLNSRHERDLSRWVWKRKAKAWRGLDITIVAPSNWMADRARSSSLFKDARIVVIPNGQDTQKFKPRDKQMARRLFDFHPDRKLILFGAWRPDNPWKGFDLLQDSLRRIARAGRGDEVEVIVFGRSRAAIDKDLGIRCRLIDRPNGLVELPLLYCAADVFVAPSRRETQGLMAVEAALCGLPTVAFRTGGLTDVVDHGETGVLAPELDTEEFASGILWVLEDEERRRRLGESARDKAVREFSLDRMADRYVGLYRELLEARE